MLSDTPNSPVEEIVDKLHELATDACRLSMTYFGVSPRKAGRWKHFKRQRGKPRTRSLNKVANIACNAAWVELRPRARERFHAKTRFRRLATDMGHKGKLSPELERNGDVSQIWCA